MAFDLTIHKLGTNRYDEDITSCVLEEFDAPAQDDFDDEYTDRERAALDVLRDQADGNKPIKTAAWRRQLKATSPFQGISNVKSLETAMRRARDGLVDKGVALYDLEKQLLSYVGDKGATP